MAGPLLVPTNEADTEEWLAPIDATARRVTTSVLNSAVAVSVRERGAAA